MVAFDNNIFCLAIHPSAKSDVERAKDRIDCLLQDLKDENERIILPTPVLAEFLVFAGADAPQYLEQLRDNSIFRVEPFDERAAIELADVELRVRRVAGNKKGTAEGTEWQKIKIDRQIVAIAKVSGARCIYSSDADVAKHGSDFKIKVVPLKDLPLPFAMQTALPFSQEETWNSRKEDDPLEIWETCLEQLAAVIQLAQSGVV